MSTWVLTASHGAEGQGSIPQVPPFFTTEHRPPPPPAYLSLSPLHLAYAWPRSMGWTAICRKCGDSQGLRQRPAVACMVALWSGRWERSIKDSIAHQVAPSHTPLRAPSPDPRGE